MYQKIILFATLILMIGACQDEVDLTKETILFDGKYFKGSYYLAQSEFNKDQPGLIKIELPYSLKHFDYIPVVFYDGVISPIDIKDQKSVFIKLKEVNNLVYGFDLDTLPPSDFAEVDADILASLKKSRVMDFHNSKKNLVGTKDLAGHFQGHSPKPHRAGHIWAATAENKRSYLRNPNEAVREERRKSSLLDPSEAEEKNLTLFCGSENSRGLCVTMFYVNNDYYEANSELFTYRQLGSTNWDRVFYETEIIQLEGKKINKLIDISYYHDHD